MPEFATVAISDDLWAKGGAGIVTEIFLPNLDGALQPGSFTMSIKSFPETPEQENHKLAALIVRHLAQTGRIYNPKELTP